MPEITMGATPPPKSLVKRNAPKNGAGFSGGARSLPKVSRMPEPTPLPSEKMIAHSYNHVTGSANERENAKTISAVDMMTIAGMADQSRPQRSMI